MSLAVTDFGEFFHALHDVEPFPWQTRLLKEIAGSGRWPSLLDLPTGTGKTAALDVALFHLALEADRGEERRAPMRIVLVVDRRTVVDQAHERARKIRNVLADRERTGVVARVRERLLLLSGPVANPQHVLQVALLRGGMARDDAWARSPNQPLIALSTVDQVGSRLLFRGYGVTDSMRPIHAGLLGNDSLLLLDEVHLSRPFCETLEAMDSRYRTWAECRLPDRAQFVQMSATPGAGVATGFTLDGADKKHAVLRERLRASRPVHLRDPITVSGGEDRRRQSLVNAIVQDVVPLVGPGKAIAIVVNRVRTARDAFDALRKKLGDSVDVRLLTGRMRPLDREHLEREIRPRVRAGRTDDPAAKPFVLVSTQCIEAGADFDFDAMVTECASLDALRQRFGRLNRLGQRECKAVMLVRNDSLGEEADDPIYGRALSATWTYLRRQGEIVDFGLEAFEMPDSEELSELVSPPVSAPTLLPAHLDGWVQTAPVPEPDNEVGLWLHGPSRGTPDVQVIWRRDLSRAELDRIAEPDILDGLIDRLNACPPSVAEALSIPFHEVIGWLGGTPRDGLGDVEGEREDEVEDEKATPAEPRWALAWRGGRTCRVGSARVRGDGNARETRIRPGDTLIVPSEYGGVPALHGNWDPLDTSVVVDLAEEALFRSRGRAVLRLDPSWFPDPSDVPIPTSADEGETEAEVRVRIREFVSRLSTATDGLSKTRKEVVHLLEREFRGRRPPKVIRLEKWAAEGKSFEFAVLGRRTHKQDPDSVDDATTEDEFGSLTGTEVGLARHLKGVGGRARDYATRIGLPAAIVEDLALAGAWHDAGKADQRFQQLLRRGDAFAVTVAKEPLAKSGMLAGDRRAFRRARERSGLPAGFRHELVSIALMNTAEAAVRDSAHDWELVLHLVASHHGSCRPLAPAIDDPTPVEVHFEGPRGAVRAGSDHRLARLDSGVSQRFWRLVRRYGWHGLAWLETILRLADHRQSEFEQEEDQEKEASAP